jgi:hypothetical protein
MISQYAMWAAGICYLTAAAAYYHEGKVWIATTMLLYAASVITVWMGGNR